MYRQAVFVASEEVTFIQLEIDKDDYNELHHGDVWDLGVWPMFYARCSWNA
jgi:hypothetical protein